MYETTVPGIILVNVAILANTHKPIFLPLMEDREMALKMWHPGSRNTCVISKDSLILALAARSPSPCSADSKINHFFPLAQWILVGGLGGIGALPFFFFFGGQIEPTATFFPPILIKLSAKLAESSLSTYHYGRVVRIPYPATQPHVCSCTELS